MSLRVPASTLKAQYVKNGVCRRANRCRHQRDATMAPSMAQHSASGSTARSVRKRFRSSSFSATASNSALVPQRKATPGYSQGRVDSVVEMMGFEPTTPTLRT